MLSKVKLTFVPSPFTVTVVFEGRGGCSVSSINWANVKSPDLVKLKSKLPKFTKYPLVNFESFTIIVPLFLRPFDEPGEETLRLLNVTVELLSTVK